MGFSSARNLGRDISAGFSPPRRMPISEAVKKFMRVPKGAGNSVPWDPELTPYIIEPMNCLASREYDAVIFVGPARTGKTIGLIDGWIVYTIVCDPSDMLVVQMTEDKAREHSKKRLDRTFRSSAAVKKRMSPRRNDNNVHDKTFRDGSFLKIGWPSVNIMSSSDYRFVALTDYDRFPENIDSEGDGFSLASKRTTTFMSAGMTLVESSPGRDICDSKWRRKSPHEAPPTTGILSLYNRGDRRRWYWPCPHCGEYFQPAMDAMTGYRNEPDPFKASEAAYLLCPHCSGIITAEKKRELNSAGVWLREGQVIDRNGNVSGEPRRSRIASFWMEGPAAAYQTWAQLVYKLLTAEQEYEATGSEETLRAVINTDWGLPYLPRASMEQRKSELLEQRAEPVPSRSVPDGVNFLVATVDVQAGRHRRFVVQVTGYGSRGERWIIDRYNITQSLRSDCDGESQRIDPASYQMLQAQCLADPECSLEQAREKLLNEMGRESTPSNKNTPAHIYAGNGNFVGDGIRQALMARAGFEKNERDNVYNGMTLREYARMSLTERGIGVSGYNPMQMVGAAFTHSTSDFGNILLDVANKAILQGWEDAPETYEQWTRKGQLSDFKIAHRVGMGGFSALRQVREGAEYKYVTTGDKQATIALATYGELFSITRQAIINDDLNMLTDVPMKLGRAAKSTIADLVYAILTSNPKISTDNVSLFDKAKHANVLESAAMDVASLDKARQLMRVQKEGERHLNIRPAFVLVPTAMESVANQVIRSSSVKGADINAGIINPVKDFATVIAEPRLDDNSQTTFYLAASKGSDTIEVAYLNGVDTPYIDQMEGFSVDGVTTKVRIDAGVAPVDHRGLVKCTA
ncbi:ClpP-like prohead protease/major capsid protein fusion protein [Escherichia coli]